MIAAIRTGDLDFSLSLWNTHFLSALRTLEDPMCFIRVLFSETVPDGRSQFQELLVFCLSARNISGKNAVVGIDKHRNGNHVDPFKPGAFKSAMKSKVPIVPVALVDSWKVYDLNSLRRVRTQIYFLKPLYYEDYKDLKSVEVCDQVYRRVCKAVKLGERNMPEQAVRC